MSRFAVDWDATLVDREQKWLPYAAETLRALLADGHTVIVHSCRANWPEGLASIHHKLTSAHLPVDVWADKGKPDADFYVGNNYVYFDGDWPKMLTLIRAAQAQIDAADGVPLHKPGKTRPRKPRPRVFQ